MRRGTLYRQVFNLSLFMFIVRMLFGRGDLLAYERYNVLPFLCLFFQLRTSSKHSRRVFITEKTTCRELITQVMRAHDVTDPADDFSLYEVDSNSKGELETKEASFIRGAQILQIDIWEVCRTF